MAAHTAPVRSTSHRTVAWAAVADAVTYWSGMAAIYMSFGFLWYFAAKEKLFDQNASMPDGLAKAYDGSFLASFPGLDTAWLLLGLVEAVAFLGVVASLAAGEFLKDRAKPILRRHARLLDVHVRADGLRAEHDRRARQRRLAVHLHGRHRRRPGGRQVRLAVPRPRHGGIVSSAVRALVFEGVGRPLRLMERSRPAPSADQRLLRVEACGLLPRRTREPLPARPLHRPRRRRRPGRVCRRRRALLLPDRTRVPGRAGRAAPVRGPDRLPRTHAVR